MSINDGAWKAAPAGVPKSKPLPPPDNVIQEVTYRDYRIVLTDDKRLVGFSHPDSLGFTTDRGFIVLDEFDAHVFPAGMHWFYTPHDAIAAIEMLDTILPTIKEGQPWTTLLYEYTQMQQCRREWHRTYFTMLRIRKLCIDARDLDDNPREEIIPILDTLRQSAAESRSIG